MIENKTEVTRDTGQDASDQGGNLDKDVRETESRQRVAEKQEIATSGDSEMDTRQKAGVWAGAAKAIEGGVGFVGDKAPKVASFVVHKVRKGASVAYGTGSKIVRDAYRTSSEYADKYKHKAEMKRLQEQRESVSARLGSEIYTRIVVDEEPPDKLFLDQRITSLLDQIQKLDNDVVKIGKDLEKQ
jgi:hypothetical protein